MADEAAIVTPESPSSARTVDGVSQGQAPDPKASAPADLPVSAEGVSPEPVVASEPDKPAPPLDFLAEHDAKDAEAEAARVKAVEAAVEAAAEAASKASTADTAKSDKDSEKAKDGEKAEKPEKAEKAAKSDEKPVEAEKAKEEPKPEEAVAEPPPPEPEPFSLDSLVIPEDFKRDFNRAKPQLDKFQELLNEAEISKQDRAQGYLDLHAEAMREYAARLEADRDDAWTNVRKTWRAEVLSDEELGGAAHETAMGAVARGRDLLVPDHHRAEFNAWLGQTGSGFHKALLRVFRNAARLWDETQAVDIPSQIKPPPDNGMRPGRKSSVLYDHDRSRGV